MLLGHVLYTYTNTYHQDHDNVTLGRLKGIDELLEVFNVPFRFGFHFFTDHVTAESCENKNQTILHLKKKNNILSYIVIFFHQKGGKGCTGD